MGYAFISYSSKNHTSADSLKELLKRNGISTWMAPGDIPIGKEYAEMITDALKDCACFVLLLTRQSQKSKWVSKELERAVSYKKPIIPVMLEQTSLDGKFELYLSEYQLFALYKLDNNSVDMKRIIEGIRAHTQSSIPDFESMNPILPPTDLHNDDLYVGKIVAFGHYYFDNEKQLQPINWIVLKIKYGKALLISCNILDGKPFNTDASTNLWKDCSLRKWMNHEFYDAAFSEEEKEYVLPTMNFTERSGKTTDHVFLLSREDAQNYFSSNSSRCCKATDFAKFNDVYPSVNPNYCGNSWWWLRTSSNNPKHACFIGYDGSLRNYTYVADDSVGIRPAIYIPVDTFLAK